MNVLARHLPSKKMGQFLSSYFSSASTPQKPHISHVIFDFDGVLIDSEIQYMKVMKLCVKPYGKEFTLEQKLKIMGCKKYDAIEKLIEFNDLAEEITHNKMLDTYNNHLEDNLLDCPILPGADELIKHLHKHEVPIAIYTGSDADEFEQKTRKNLQHWLKMIELRVLAGSDPEVKRGKPAPDGYLVTYNRFPTQPESPSKCLVFEDSINGARSALEANMNCILIPQQQFMCKDTEESIEELRPRLTDVLSSLEEFKPEHYGLPAFNA